jgi:hypothetical protein
VFFIGHRLYPLECPNLLGGSDFQQSMQRNAMLAVLVVQRRTGFQNNRGGSHDGLYLSFVRRIRNITFAVSACQSGGQPAIFAGCPGLPGAPDRGITLPPAP